MNERPLQISQQSAPLSLSPTPSLPLSPAISLSQRVRMCGRQIAQPFMIGEGRREKGEGKGSKVGMVKEEKDERKE